MICGIRPNEQKLSRRRTVTLANQKTYSQNRSAFRRLGALLGIAQRTVEVFYGQFMQRFSPRKLIPTEAKTLGDHLLLKRIKADLTQPELARKSGVTVRTVKAWEHDAAVPTETEWGVLEQILNLDSSLKPKRT